MCLARGKGFREGNPLCLAVLEVMVIAPTVVAGFVLCSLKIMYFHQLLLQESNIRLS